MSIALVSGACAHRSGVGSSRLRLTAPEVLLQSESRLCTAETTVGDTVRAHVLSGGDSLSPPLPAGTPARLRVTQFRVARTADFTDHAQFALAIIDVGGRPASLSVAMRHVGVEYKFRADSASGTWYICLLPSSIIFLIGDRR